MVFCAKCTRNTVQTQIFNRKLPTYVYVLSQFLVIMLRTMLCSSKYVSYNSNHIYVCVYIRVMQSDAIQRFCIKLIENLLLYSSSSICVFCYRKINLKLCMYIRTYMHAHNTHMYVYTVYIHVHMFSCNHSLLSLLYSELIMLHFICVYTYMFCRRRRK